MIRSGPRESRANRRLLTAFALAVVLLLAANPASVLIHPDQSGSGSIVAADSPRVAQEPCSGQCRLAGGLSLASIFPLTGDREAPKRSDPEVVGLTDERAGELFDVLSSGTARELLHQLSEEPQTASELSDVADTSLQNVHYHLGNLREAGAIEEIDVEYSSRGREMSVYAATCRPQVLLYDVG